MTTIRVDEREQRADGAFDARVAFDDAGEYDVVVSDPAESGDENTFAWYFEQHLRFPFLDKDREQLAVERLTGYGTALFGQLFRDSAYADYRRLRECAFDGCRLEVTGSSAFQRLHWEALRDPELESPLAVRLPVSRRVERLPFRFALPPERTTLNILLVTARPDGPRDVGYRTISRPLLKVPQQAELPVALDLVRPGTWDALRAHLQTVTDRNGSGWYQIVHFDLHGAFCDFDWLDTESRAGRFVFQATRLEPFASNRAFLFFETAREGQAERSRPARWPRCCPSIGCRSRCSTPASRRCRRSVRRVRAAAGGGGGAGRGRDGVLGDSDGRRTGDAGAVRAIGPTGRSGAGDPRRPPRAVCPSQPARLLRPGPGA